MSMNSGRKSPLQLPPENKSNFSALDFKIQQIIMEPGQSAQKYDDLIWQLVDPEIIDFVVKNQYTHTDSRQLIRKIESTIEDLLNKNLNIDDLLELVLTYAGSIASSKIKSLVENMPHGHSVFFASMQENLRNKAKCFYKQYRGFINLLFELAEENKKTIYIIGLMGEDNTGEHTHHQYLCQLARSTTLENSFFCFLSDGYHANNVYKYQRIRFREQFVQARDIYDFLKALKKSYPSQNVAYSIICFYDDLLNFFIEPGLNAKFNQFYHQLIANLLVTANSRSPETLIEFVLSLLQINQAVNLEILRGCSECINDPLMQKIIEFFSEATSQQNHVAHDLMSVMTNQQDAHEKINSLCRDDKKLALLTKMALDGNDVEKHLAIKFFSLLNNGHDEIKFLKIAASNCYPFLYRLLTLLTLNLIPTLIVNFFLFISKLNFFKELNYGDCRLYSLKSRVEFQRQQQKNEPRLHILTLITQGMDEVSDYLEYGINAPPILRARNYEKKTPCYLSVRPQ